MPTIPVYQRRVSIPGEAPAVPANVGSAGLVGESISGFGKTELNVTDEVVNIIVRRNEEMRQQNNAFAILKAQNSIDVDTRTFKESYDVKAKKGDYDPAGLMEFTNEQVDEFSKKIDKDYLSNVEDPDQKVKIEAYRNSAISHVLDHASIFQANHRKDFADNEVDRAGQMSLQDAREGTDPGIVRDKMRLKIGELHASGYYSATQAEDMIVKSDQQITVAYFDYLVLMDPAKAIERLNDRAYSQYLPEADYRRLMEKARVEKIRIDKEQKITNVANGLTAEFNLDKENPSWEGAIKELYRPENLTKWGITFQESQQIFSNLHARYEFEQKSKHLIKKQEEDKIKSSAFDLVNKGNIRDAFDLLDKSNLDRDDVYTIKQKVITDQRQDAHYKEWLSRDNAEKIQKKAEHWLLNNVKGDKAGFAIQTYRSGLIQNNLGPERFEEYARQVSALPEYSKKTSAADKLAKALGLPVAAQQNQALKPTPLKVFNDISARIKSGEITRKKAEEITREMGYDPETLEQSK